MNVEPRDSNVCEGDVTFRLRGGGKMAENTSATIPAAETQLTVAFPDGTTWLADAEVMGVQWDGAFRENTDPPLQPGAVYEQEVSKPPPLQPQGASCACGPPKPLPKQQCIFRYRDDRCNGVASPESNYCSSHFPLKPRIIREGVVPDPACRTAVAQGIMTINEVRRREGLPSIGPAGDVRHGQKDAMWGSDAAVCNDIIEPGDTVAGDEYPLQLPQWLRNYNWLGLLGGCAYAAGCWAMASWM